MDNGYPSSEISNNIEETALNDMKRFISLLVIGNYVVQGQLCALSPLVQQLAYDSLKCIDHTAIQQNDVYLSAMDDIPFDECIGNEDEDQCKEILGEFQSERFDIVLIVDHIYIEAIKAMRIHSLQSLRMS